MGYVRKSLRLAAGWISGVMSVLKKVKVTGSARVIAQHPGICNFFGDFMNYREYLDTNQDQKDLEEIRDKIMHGGSPGLEHRMEMLYELIDLLHDGGYQKVHVLSTGNIWQVRFLGYDPLDIREGYL